MFKFLLVVSCLLLAGVQSQYLKVDVVRLPPYCSVRTKVGDTITINYVGKLVDGEVFDSTFQQNRPTIFELGAGKVIKGWDEGLVGMCVGEKRVLTIPPSLAFGETGIGNVIPWQATVIYEIDLIDISPKPFNFDIFKAVDISADSKLNRKEVIAHVNDYIQRRIEAAHGDELEQLTNLTEVKNDLIDRIFEIVDKDKNGILTYAEFIKAKKEAEAEGVI